MLNSTLMDQQDSFEFLFNVGGLEGPLEVLPGHVVDRATATEVATIKDVLGRFSFMASPVGSPYEVR